MERPSETKAYKANMKQGRVLNPTDLALSRMLEGKPVTPFFGRGRSFLIHDPVLVRDVLGKQHETFVEDPHPFIYLRPILSENGHDVLMLGREKSPADSNAMDRLHEAVITKTERLCQRWERTHGDGKPFDLFPELATTVIEIMGLALFDFEMGELTESFFKANMAHEDYLAMARRGDPKLRDSAEFREKGRVAMAAQEAVAKVVRDYRKTQAAVSEQKETNPPIRSDLSMERAMVRTFLNAYAGVTTTLSWLGCVLASYPEVQRRVFQEASSVFSSGKMASEFQRLRWGRAVILETLRLYPAAWMMSRTAVRDARIGDVDVPKGADVFVCAYSLHRDPKLWRDPDEFVPERFENDEYGGGHPYAYVPFGAGPHKCVGMRFAMSTLQLMLAQFSVRFEFLPVPDMEISPFPRVALRPEPGAFVILKKREAGHA